MEGTVELMEVEQDLVLVIPKPPSAAEGFPCASAGWFPASSVYFYAGRQGNFYCYIFCIYLQIL